MTMAFTHTSSLMTELDALGSAVPSRPTGRWRPADHDVGTALVSIAAGKFDWSGTDVAGDESQQAHRRSAAQRVLLTLCLRSDADHYELLAVRADASAEQIRDAYRRMIALVHPDSSPVGFPADAASRVNLAYSTLGDAAKRAAYDTAQSLPQASSAAALQNSALRANTSLRTTAAPRRRVRASRKALLWLAALAVIPAAALLYSALPGSNDVDLVEARPKLKMSDRPSQSSASPPTTADAAAVDATTGGSLPTAKSPAPLLGAQLATEAERRPLSDPTAVDGGAAVAGSTSAAAAAVDTPTASRASRHRDVLRPSPVIPPPTPSALRSEDAASTAMTASESAGRLPDASPAAGRLPAEPTPAPVQAVRAPAPLDASLKTTSAATTPAIDTDDVLMRLVTAYETGSASALGRLLSPQMAGRRALLADYERIFRETTARTLRLGQLRHQRFDDRVKSSGPATVLTVSRDQQTAEQRVFLEIEIVRDRDQVFIERLASYAAK